MDTDTTRTKQQRFADKLKEESLCHRCGINYAKGWNCPPCKKIVAARNLARYHRNKMKVYVLGYYFNDDLTRVTLIQKNKPEDQLGRLNGVGGKLEAYDFSANDAMVREFSEESGTSVSDWTEIGTYGDSRNYLIHVFTAKGDLEPFTAENEEVINLSLTDINQFDLVNGVMEHIEQCMNYYEKVYGWEIVQHWKTIKEKTS